MSEKPYMVYTRGCGYRKFFATFDEALEHALEKIADEDIDELFVGDDVDTMGTVDEDGYHERVWDEY